MDEGNDPRLANGVEISMERSKFRLKPKIVRSRNRAESRVRRNDGKV
jgi:hypothetical protein